MTSKRIMQLMKNWLETSLVRNEIEVVSYTAGMADAFIHIKHRDSGKKILIRIEEE